MPAIEPNSSLCKAQASCVCLGPRPQWTGQAATWVQQPPVTSALRKAAEPVLYISALWTQPTPHPHSQDVPASPSGLHPSIDPISVPPCRKISHRRHHSNCNSLDKDEAFVPNRREEPSERFELSQLAVVRFAKIVVSLTLGWPLYLLFNLSGRDYGRYVNHFDPYAPVFS